MGGRYSPLQRHNACCPLRQETASLRLQSTAQESTPDKNASPAALVYTLAITIAGHSVEVQSVGRRPVVTKAHPAATLLQPQCPSP